MTEAVLVTDTTPRSFRKQIGIIGLYAESLHRALSWNCYYRPFDPHGKGSHELPCRERKAEIRAIACNEVEKLHEAMRQDLLLLANMSPKARQIVSCVCSL